MSKAQNIEKLLTIKSLRRKLAEMEAAKANAAVFSAEDAVSRAAHNEEVVKDNSTRIRNERISELLQEPENVSVQNALIGSAFARTAYEIHEAIEQTSTRQKELQSFKELATEKQKNLARFLQKEERAKQFVERLKAEESLETLRSE